MQELQGTVQKVGQAVYSQGGAPPDGSAEEENAPPDTPPEGTVEGEFREV